MLFNIKRLLSGKKSTLFSPIFLWMLIVYLVVAFIGTIVYGISSHLFNGDLSQLIWPIGCFLFILLFSYIFFASIQKKIFLLSTFSNAKYTIDFLKKQKIYGVFASIFFFRNRQRINSECVLLSKSAKFNLSNDVNLTKLQLISDFFNNSCLLSTITISIITVASLISLPSINESLPLVIFGSFCIAFGIFKHFDISYKLFVNVKNMYHTQLITKKASFLEFFPIVNWLIIFYAKISKI